MDHYDIASVRLLVSFRRYTLILSNRTRVWLVPTTMPMPLHQPLPHIERPHLSSKPRSAMLSKAVGEATTARGPIVNISPNPAVNVAASIESYFRYHRHDPN